MIKHYCDRCDTVVKPTQMCRVTLIHPVVGSMGRAYEPRTDTMVTEVCEACAEWLARELKIELPEVATVAHG